MTRYPELAILRRRISAELFFAPFASGFTPGHVLRPDKNVCAVEIRVGATFIFTTPITST